MFGTVKVDLIEVFEEFFEPGRTCKGINSTSLVLIQKGGAKHPKDFRIISLGSSVYRIIPIVARRLREVVRKVVGEVQCAFVREIHACWNPNC